jgi:hypothetical protein
MSLNEYELIQVLSDRMNESVKHLATQADIAQLREELKAHKAHEEKDKAKRQKFNVTAVAAAVTAVGSVVSNFFKL